MKPFKPPALYQPFKTSPKKCNLFFYFKWIRNSRIVKFTGYLGPFFDMESQATIARKYVLELDLSLSQVRPNIEFQLN